MRGLRAPWSRLHRKRLDGHARLLSTCTCAARGQLAPVKGLQFLNRSAAKGFAPSLSRLGHLYEGGRDFAAAAGKRSAGSRDQTGGRFKDGAVARVLAMQFWTHAEAPTLEAFARAWTHSDWTGRGGLPALVADWVDADTAPRTVTVGQQSSVLPRI